MKKALLVLTIMLSLMANSQVTFRPGVRLGMNVAKITNVDDDSRIDFYAGVFGELKLGQKYALQPEISYSKQGSKNVELDYLSISIANKFYFLNENTPVYVLIAPNVDFNLHGKTESYSDNSGTGVNFEADISFSGGLGYDFPFGLSAEVRYKHGIVDIDSFGSSSTYYDEKRLNSLIQIGVSYKFDF